MRFTLIAAIDEWLKLVVPFVFFIIYALNQLLSAKAQPQRPQQKKPAPEGERPLRPAQPPANEPAGSTQSQLNAEIEQFLKRANERRGDRAKREGWPPSVQTPPKKAPKPPKPPREPLREQPVDVEPLARHELSTVASSVEKHLANRGFTQRAEHLADDIVRADEQMEQHLQKSFSRRVGTLAESTPGEGTSPLTDQAPMAVSAAASPSAAIGALLANAQSLRQAIILNEVLARPVHRW